MRNLMTIPIQKAMRNNVRASALKNNWLDLKA